MMAGKVLILMGSASDAGTMRASEAMTRERLGVSE
mgnify:CR=1 FL=1